MDSKKIIFTYPEGFTVALDSLKSLTGISLPIRIAMRFSKKIRKQILEMFITTITMM